MSRMQLYNEEMEACVLEIEADFPELYYLLEETPFKGMASNKPVTCGELKDYLNTLKDQLRTFRNKQY